MTRPLTVALVALVAPGCSRPATPARPAVALAPAAPVTAPAPEVVAAPARYAGRRLAGFTVFVHEAVLAHPDVAAPLLARVEASLAGIAARFGPRRAAVAGVRVWIEWTPIDPQRRRGVAEFHRSREWLRANGYDPDKEHDVEINDARGYLEATAGAQPDALLHEFAHAYEHHALRDGDPGVEGAFEAARASGRYDDVPRAGGGRERAYAITDAREYFAETTEAFLATNDYFPFVREQLLAHDPGGHALMTRVWGPQPERPALPLRPCDGAPRSASAGANTAVVVENATARPLSLWWVDASGARRRYAEVPPGGADVRQTWAGHAWEARADDGRCLAAFVATSQVARAVIRDDAR